MSGHRDVCTLQETDLSERNITGNVPNREVTVTETEKNRKIRVIDRLTNCVTQ